MSNIKQLSLWENLENHSRENLEEPTKKASEKENALEESLSQGVEFDCKEIENDPGFLKKFNEMSIPNDPEN